MYLIYIPLFITLVLTLVLTSVGVFPTIPNNGMQNFKKRQGARIAITSRIAPLDALDRVTEYRNSKSNPYKQVIDPNVDTKTISWAGE